MQFQSAYYQADGRWAVCLQQVTLKKRNLQVFLGILFAAPHLLSADSGLQQRYTERIKEMSAAAGAWLQNECVNTLCRSGSVKAEYLRARLGQLLEEPLLSGVIFSVGKQIFLQKGEQGGIFLLRQGFGRSQLEELPAGMYEAEAGTAFLLTAFGPDMTAGDMQVRGQAIAACLHPGGLRAELLSQSQTESRLREVVLTEGIGGAIYLEMRE